MSLTKKLIAFIGCIVIFGFIIIGMPIDAAEMSTVFYDFNTEEELLDFSPFFVEHESGTDGKLESFSKRFINEEGQITSKKLSGGNGSTGNIAFLTLSKYQFQNFEAELVLNFVGDASWGWGGLSFRQKSVGNGWRRDGCLAFVQREGFATLWGSDAFDDTAYEGVRPSDFNKNQPFLMKIKVVNNKAEVWVSSVDETVFYSSVVCNFNKSEAEYPGYISLASIDNSHTFHSLKITALDTEGTPTALTENQIPTAISFSETPTAFTVGTAATIKVAVMPDDFPLSSLLWESSDPEVAIIKGGSVIGIKPGSVTVTACSPFNLDIKAEINLTFTEGTIRPNEYILNDETISKYFTANYVRSETDSEAGNENIEDHWSFTDNNSIIRTNLNPLAASDQDIATLYLNHRLYNNFEATLLYRNVDGEYGWVGITNGVKSKTNRFIDDGQGFFIQREGIATIWGRDIGGPHEARVDRYSLSAWHVLKVKVFGQKVEIYVDDLINPTFVETLKTKPQGGEIGLFTSGRAQIEIKSLTVDYLNEDGEIVEFEEITGFAIADKITSAAVGDKIALNIETEPTGQDIVYTVSTSNGNICFYNNGMLYFIGSGEVTITVEYSLNLSLKDSMTVNVVDNSSKDPIYYYPTPEPEPEEPKSGCAGQTFAFGLLSFMSLLGMLIYRKKS